MKDGDEIYFDPLDDNFLELIDKVTRINHIFYWNVFRYYPHEKLKTIKDV